MSTFLRIKERNQKRKGRKKSEIIRKDAEGRRRKSAEGRKRTKRIRKGKRGRRRRKFSEVVR